MIPYNSPSTSAERIRAMARQRYLASEPGMFTPDSPRPMPTPAWSQPEPEPMMDAVPARKFAPQDPKPMPKPGRQKTRMDAPTQGPRLFR